MAVTDYSTVAGNNTSINGINIDEGCPPASINDAIRNVMSDFATWRASAQVGTVIANSGSLGAPSYTFTGATDTGFYRSAADTVAAVSGGVIIARFAPDEMRLSKPLSFGDNPIDGGMLVVADDGVASVTPPRQGGFVFITTQQNVDDGKYFTQWGGVVRFGLADSPSVIAIPEMSGPNFEAVSTGLTGTTGTDGNIAIGHNGSVLRVENRSGLTRRIFFTII